MKELIDYVKKKPTEFVTLFVSLIIFNIATTFFMPVIFVNITQWTSISTLEWCLGILLFHIPISGIIFISFRLNEISSKLKIVSNLFFLLLITIVSIASFSIGADYLLKTIYQSISGSIATIKIILDSTISILRVPIDTLLVCLFGNVICKGKLFKKISSKKYFTVLLACFFVWVIKFLFLLIPVNIVTLILLCLIISFVATLIVAMTLHQKGAVKNEMV